MSQRRRHAPCCREEAIQGLRAVAATSGFGRSPVKASCAGSAELGFSAVRQVGWSNVVNAATAPRVHNDERQGCARSVRLPFNTACRACGRNLGGATASVAGRSQKEVGHTLALRAAALRRAVSLWLWAQSALASLAWVTLAAIEQAHAQDMNTATQVARTQSLVPHVPHRRNPSLNRTRNGRPRLGLISFWPKRVLPSRAG
jgi:hypothetical protein